MLPLDEGRFRVARARRLEEASIRAGGRGCGEEGVGLRLVPRGLLRPREGPRLLRRLPDGEQGAALHALRAPPRAEARLRVPEAGGRREDPAARAEEEAERAQGVLRRDSEAQRSNDIHRQQRQDPSDRVR